MGLDYTSLHAVLRAERHVGRRRRAVTLGRQHVHVTQDVFEGAGREAGFDLRGCYAWESDSMFRHLGFERVDSIDRMPDEGASILHDMNIPMSFSLRADFVYDGGTLEHIFSTPVALSNVFQTLDVGGVFCSVTPNNNQSGHGFYQFSPELFLSTVTPRYGMELLELYLGEVGSRPDSWVSVKSYGSDGSGRNTFRFSSPAEVYIIAIGRKVSNEGASLLSSPPTQHSYEMGIF